MRQTSCPLLRVTLQREGGIHVRRGIGLGVRVGVKRTTAAPPGLTYMTSIWAQWGPAGVTFTLWMFLG